MDAFRRLALGATLLSAALLWRIKGPEGGELSGLGPFPDLRAGDVVTVPLLASGLACLAAAPALTAWRRALGASGLMAALLWVTVELPFDDPLVPGFQFGRHGMHVLDVLAAFPFVGGLILLFPELSSGP